MDLETYFWKIIYTYWWIRYECYKRNRKINRGQEGMLKITEILFLLKDPGLYWIHFQKSG